jgi:TolB-like protein
MTSNAEILNLIQPAKSESLAPSIDRVRDELDRILKSKTFQRAKRLRTLLKYVVDAATTGKSSGQSETARELFGRSGDFDPSLDPVIRVHFGRLRRALSSYYSSEGNSDPVVINIPTRSYAPVFEANRVQAMDSDDTDGVDPSRPLIAVLPFANLTSDPSQDSFCYGVTEEIANALASVATVDVVASRSSFQFKDQNVDIRDVGSELGAGLVLEGSVRMEDGRTRVIAQLARSNDGVAVWSGSFDDELNGSLNTQQSIAQKVIEALPVEITPVEPNVPSSAK